MKLLLLTLIISLQEITFDEIDKAIEDRKYSTAFQLLSDLDPENKNPEAFRRKIDICIDNYIMSMGHQMFALKNLEPGEEINKLRGRDGSYDMYSLDVATIATQLIADYPENYELKFAIGRYYHSMHLNCGNCSMSATERITKFERLFEECYENDVYDYFSFYGIAYAKINKQEYEASIPFFLRSIELNDEYASSHYNLAIAYLYLEKREKSIEYAKNAIERYSYHPTYQADAARITAMGYEFLEDFENAYTYFKMANKINPGDYYNLKPLLNISLQLKKEDARAIREELFLIGTDNPTVYQELIYAYFDYGEINDLLAYFKSKIPTYKEDFATLGSLHFYIGKIQLDEGETEKAKQSLITAKNTFSKVYPEDHQVFPVIEQIMADGKLEE